MKIGIDLDGTAWDHPELFSDLIAGLRKMGHSCYILTAHINLKEKDLALWGARGFSSVDGYISKVYGEQNIPSRDWKITKAKELGLDYIFDDFDTKEIRIVKI